MKPLDSDLIIVDESSMLDISLTASLVRAIKPQSRLILVGDINQLPSVGPGSVLKDIIRSGCANVVTLTDIQRQALGSDITVNAHKIINGEMPSLKNGHMDSDFHYRRDAGDAAKTVDMVVKTVMGKKADGIDPISAVQVIAPMNKGPLGTVVLNTALQEALNPKGEKFKCGNREFRNGDKVLHTKNNYEKNVFNGDIGQIVSVSKEDDVVNVRYGKDIVEYSRKDMDELTLAYAISVHKSQGSEYPHVVMPMTTNHYVMLQRNLFYTALTRARKHVSLIGSSQAIAMAVKNDSQKYRCGFLDVRLRDLRVSPQKKRAWIETNALNQMEHRVDEEQEEACGPCLC